MNNKPTVFVVDDDQAIRSSLKWLIESVAMQVKTFDSANAFIESYYPGRSGCLLLDVRMPGMDGLETYRKITEINPNQAAIIASGYSETERVKEAQRLGAGNYIRKPYTLKSLGQSIRAELEKQKDRRDKMHPK